MTVGDSLARWLRDRKISHVFTLPGGMIAAILDAIYREGHTELLTMHHEQSVAFAVDGYGRFNGYPAVGLSTGGPGATNMLTGIASCYLDSVPSLFIAGQVQSYLMKGNRAVRQFGFQECDIVAMASPVVKAAWRARTGDEAVSMLDEALTLAISGRPGPVLIELPSDVQSMPVKQPPRSEPPSAEKIEFGDLATVEALLEQVANAERPLILVGGGIQAARAADRFRSFARHLKVPVVASVMALDVMPSDDPLRLGMIGMYGNRWVNLATAECDLILVLGSRLDCGTIGTDVAAWRKGRTIVQVDCDAGEMKRVKSAHTIVADLGQFLDAALPLARRRSFPERVGWSARLDELRRAWPDTEELAGCPGINPNILMRQISSASKEAAAYVIDAGQHLWWACQSILPAEGQRFHPALGLGPCGFSIPAAIGVAASSRKPVVVIVGDGALQFNIQEFQTIVRNKLAVKIVVLNNRCHGSVRQLQEKLFNGRYPSTVSGYDAPDFERIAQAYGIPGTTVSEPYEVERGLGWLWNDPERAALLQVMISPELNVFPNVPFGSPITTMESLARPRDVSPVPAYTKN
jgi:acetolactate synthase I/II/III large subunit